jgi:hypothetical protein
VAGLVEAAMGSIEVVEGIVVMDDYFKWLNDEYIISEKEWLDVMKKPEEERKRRIGFGFSFKIFE